MPHLSKAFNPPPAKKEAEIGTPGYDNPRENIDPHLKTKVVSAKEITLSDGTGAGFVKNSASGVLSGGNTIGQDEVTLAGTPDYITISGQVITRNTVDVSDDTNLAVETPITLTGDTIGLTTVTIAKGGTNNTTAYTAGSVVFSDGTKLTQDNANLFWDDTNNRLGLGQDTPITPLHLKADACLITTEDGDAGVDEKIWQIGNSMVGNGFWGIRTRVDDNSTGAQRLAINKNGVLGLDANMSFPGTGTNGIALHNGTALASMGADTSGFYAGDISSSSEMFAIDEAGNATQLTPHNFSLFTPDADFEYPWSYYAENKFLGKRINVDMFGVIRALEKLSGKKFIHLDNIPADERLDWDEEQEKHRIETEERIKTCKDRGWDVPAPHVKKPEPEWIKVRKV